MNCGESREGGMDDLRCVYFLLHQETEQGLAAVPLLPSTHPHSSFEAPGKGQRSWVRINEQRQ